MPQPRSTLVSVSDTPYYHVVSRCVRRAFLCGFDTSTGKNYEHRRQWIETRIRMLSSVFAIDICAYAVMSNHLHIVLKICPEQLSSLSNTDVLRRWGCLFKGPLLMQKALQGGVLSKAEDHTLHEMCDVYRQRLSSLSWFMKCLNEPIARQANQEDQCTGHFWEARFKSQALLTEETLLTCMAYVDLNPVRARMADTPETSEHTSIKERLSPTLNLKKIIAEHLNNGILNTLPDGLKPLSPFEGGYQEVQGNEPDSQEQQGIFFSLADYLQLVDDTARVIRHDKRGFISQLTPPILERLTISQQQWLQQVTEFEKLYNKKFRQQHAKLKTANSS